MNEKARYWAIKTTEGGPKNTDHWGDFLREQVVAVGWSRIKIDPTLFRGRRDEFLARVVAKYGTILRREGSRDPRYAASTIYKFANDWGDKDEAIICAGYAPNQTKPVHIYGVAKVAKFSFDSHSTWWTFKREAKITPIDQDMPVQHLIPILGGSLRQTIHHLSEKDFRRFAKLKQIGHYLRLLDNLENKIAEIAEIARAEASGQGFRVTPELRKLMEAHAVERATKFFQLRGYSVKDVGRIESFDLECQKGQDTLRVEVKGTQTDGASVILTPNEVLNAKKHSTALFVLHSIKCRKIGKSTVPAGGEPFVLNPWRVEAHGRLKPLSYMYEIHSHEQKIK